MSRNIVEIHIRPIRRFDSCPDYKNITGLNSALTRLSLVVNTLIDTPNRVRCRYYRQRGSGTLCFYLQSGGNWVSQPLRGLYNTPCNGEHRFESCPDYKDIYLRIVLAIRNSTERVIPSERSPQVVEAVEQHHISFQIIVRWRSGLTLTWKSLRSGNQVPIL